MTYNRVYYAGLQTPDWGFLKSHIPDLYPLAIVCSLTRAYQIPQSKRWMIFYELFRQSYKESNFMTS